MTAKDKWIAERCFDHARVARNKYEAAVFEKENMKQINLKVEADAEMKTLLEGLKTLLGWNQE